MFTDSPARTAPSLGSSPRRGLCPSRRREVRRAPRATGQGQGPGTQQRPFPGAACLRPLPACLLTRCGCVPLAPLAAQSLPVGDLRLLVSSLEPFPLHLALRAGLLGVSGVAGPAGTFSRKRPPCPPDPAAFRPVPPCVEFLIPLLPGQGVCCVVGLVFFLFFFFYPEVLHPENE